MNAWPALQTMVADGWVIRFAGGITRRSNSVIPLSFTGGDPEKNIDFCESLYGNKKLKPAFKLTPACCPGNLDEILEGRNYIREAETSVQILDISGKSFNPERDVIFDNSVNEQWLLDFIKLSGLNLKSYDTYFRIIENIVLEKCLVSLLVKGKTAAVGFGVRQEGYIGIFDVIINKRFRGKGFGRVIVESLMRWGQSVGAGTAYLQVMDDNLPALNLYEKLGFKSGYKYWYRIKK